MGHFNATSYTKFKESARLVARDDWQRFITDDARLASNLESAARHAGFEAIHLYDTDPDRADAETVCVACTIDELAALVESATASTRRLACWGNMGEAPRSVGAWMRHFAEWLSARWTAYRDSQLRPLILAMRGGQPLDLDSPRTLTYWMEYLAEYSERAQAWTQFEYSQRAVAR